MIAVFRADKGQVIDGGVLSTLNNVGFSGTETVAIDLADKLPIFPGAEGFGTTTPAGRGGTVYKVTNLNASGSGSLRDCIDATGPRVCVFEVSGNIEVSGYYTGQFGIKNPYITIAGQTAPSPGITIKGGPIVVNTHDVLIQHLRVRVGDDPGGLSPAIRDGIMILGDGSENCEITYNVVIDHCSISWAIDENINTYSGCVKDITISNSIISEGLYDSIHPKGRHSCGMLIGAGGENISILNNLFAHNTHRNPLIKSNTTTLLVNNVIYNAIHSISIGGRSENKPLKASVVGNFIITGVNSRYDFSEFILFKSGIPTNSSIYVDYNYSPWHYCIEHPDPWCAVQSYGDQDKHSFKADIAPVWVAPLTVRPSSDVTKWVLANAGARPTDRDTVDIRIVNDVRNTTGRIINSQNEVGGWPDLAQNYRELIIPDNPNGDDDGDGYTNLEEWLHTFPNP